MEGREAEVSYLKEAIRKLEIASITHDDKARDALVLEADVNLTFVMNSRRPLGRHKVPVAFADTQESFEERHRNGMLEDITHLGIEERWREDLAAYGRHYVEIPDDLREHLAEEYQEPDTGIAERHKTAAAIVVSCIVAAALIAAVTAWM